MTKLTFGVAVMLVAGCSVSMESGESTLNLSREEIASHDWLYHPALTSVPIAADELSGPEAGLVRVELRAFDREIVACDPMEPGMALGVWRTGEVHENPSEGDVIVPGGETPRTPTVNDIGGGRGLDNPNFRTDETGTGDDFGLDRFADDLRDAMESSNFYIFHPGCA